MYTWVGGKITLAENFQFWKLPNYAVCVLHGAEDSDPGLRPVLRRSGGLCQLRPPQQARFTIHHQTSASNPHLATSPSQAHLRPPRGFAQSVSCT